MSKKDNSKLHNNSALRAITLLTERVLKCDIFIFFPHATDYGAIAICAIFGDPRYLRMYLSFSFCCKHR